jgi:hypothetical protein
VCGRHPIAVLLNMLQACCAQTRQRFAADTRFYDQSSRCLRPADSSVSYAAVVLLAGRMKADEAAEDLGDPACFGGDGGD